MCNAFRLLPLMFCFPEYWQRRAKLVQFSLLHRSGDCRRCNFHHGKVHLPKIPSWERTSGEKYWSPGFLLKILISITVRNDQMSKCGDFRELFLGTTRKKLGCFHLAKWPSKPAISCNSIPNIFPCCTETIGSNRAWKKKRESHPFPPTKQQSSACLLLFPVYSTNLFYQKTGKKHIPLNLLYSPLLSSARKCIRDTEKHPKT